MTNQELFDRQSVFVIECLMKHQKMSREQATKTWYNSKTRKLIQENKINLSFVSRTRCYDEMLMELENHPMWMASSFE